MSCSRRIVCSVFLLVILWPGGFGDAGESQRHTPIVEAVRKARGCVLTVRAEKRSQFGRPGESLGTAVIVDERGYAITNRHVIADAVKVQAFFEDGTAVQAVVVREVKEHDLAILQLSGRPSFKAMPLGPSSDLEQGEDVIAIGNPYGYKNTVTRGIVSAVGRDIVLPSGDKLCNLIQIDAAINPGSSGGPLLNINGELIGINVAMRDGAQLIAFAIPSDTVKAILIEHLSAKQVVGIDHGLACTEEVVKPEGPNRQRVKVTGLASAAKTEDAIRPGDYIVQVADRSVANRFDLERALWDCKPGAKVPVVVDRNGQIVQVHITFAEPRGVQVSGRR
ncbi:MAG: trypsin-like peptidase domain-containing protein [Gemmatales bacterium]|nr:trypsin-like peptidase domain-containing protein [Gemmatales bacterium]MDW8387225.1 trypsin-like peptidase domain-containing protein [Gemmatales bacterium]